MDVFKALMGSDVWLLLLLCSAGHSAPCAPGEESAGEDEGCEERGWDAPSSPLTTGCPALDRTLVVHLKNCSAQLLVRPHTLKHTHTTLTLARMYATLTRHTHMHSSLLILRFSCPNTELIVQIQGKV